MITIDSNLEDIIGDLKDKLGSLNDNPDPILRACALAVMPELRNRVHVRGLDAEGNQIGTYSPAYMNVRTGSYKNAAKVSRGVNKGKLKDSGTFTRGGNVGGLRPKYNRGPDTKVVLSLTRQMENDLHVIEGDAPGTYGIGYLNPHNYDKALWCEATYNKPILTQLTKEELDLVEETKENFLVEYLK